MEVSVQEERLDAEIDDATWNLLAYHTRRVDGKRTCTLCGLPYNQHDKPLPVSFPTLVITCVGSPLKL